MKRVVLDTNCLLASISSRSEYFIVWRGLHEGKYTLCVSNDILAEYEEIIASKASPIVAKHIVDALVDSDYVEFFDPQFRLELITADPDDNKFVDCAFAANATFIVSQDHHFDILDSIDFPKIAVMRLQSFALMLRQ
ncbi:MAG: putative toxin-antitoxin system toxin component, PIN family [Bacteroidales bacterium]|nr:putative toxin-antitoxin system toxin component, PIN family [Bacteroidales bacterium]